MKGKQFEQPGCARVTWQSNRGDDLSVGQVYPKRLQPLDRTHAGGGEKYEQEGTTDNR